jgi:hypothetical protein
MTISKSKPKLMYILGSFWLPTLYRMESAERIEARAC